MSNLTGVETFAVPHPTDLDLTPREIASLASPDAVTAFLSKLGYRVEVPGKFHEFVYCAKCGDLHRHDLLGQACRECGETVGPRTNVRIEKYWHHPYLAGPPGAPIKEVVRDVHRQKIRH
jgi:hypothetical protein